MNARKCPPTETISFRLGDPLLEMLGQRAIAEGESRGEHAKRLVVRALQDETNLELLHELRLARTEVLRLRADVATSLEAVLLNVSSASAAEVKQFISDNLRG